MANLNPPTQARIPTDTPSGNTYAVFCLPNSPEWIAAVRGAISALTRGRYWNAATPGGSIRATQEVARGIYESMAICDLESILRDIETAIRAIPAAQMSVVCCDEIDAPAPPPDGYNPPDFPPPGGGVEPPTYPDPPQYDADACDTVNGVLWAYRRFFNFLANVDLYAAAAAILFSLLLPVLPAAIIALVGSATLATIASTLSAAASALTIVAIAESAEIARDWLDANKGDVACSVIATAANMEDVLSGVVSEVSGAFYSELVSRGVPADVAGKLSNLIDLSYGAAAQIVANMATTASEWTQPPNTWRVDCSCIPAEWRVLDVAPDDAAWTTSGAVTFANGEATLSRNGASSGVEAVMQLPLSAILSLSGLSEAYAVSASVSGIAACPSGSYRTVELRAQFRQWDGAPPAATQTWRTVSQPTVCISPTSGACVPSGTSEPFSFTDAAALASPYPLADGGFRLTTYRPAASGGDAAVWGSFTIQAVRIIVSSAAPA